MLTRGSGTPRIGRSRLSSGNRWMSLVSSTSRHSGTLATLSMSTMPTPRISSLPAMVAGALAINPSPSRRTIVWSSLTRVKPRSSRRKARSDLPAPDGPMIRTARPSIATALACSVSDESRRPFIPGPPLEAER
jgi:hypothetical protein